MLAVDIPSRSAVRRLASARAISFCGSTSAYVALSSAVYARTGSGVWVAAAALASFATPAILSPFAGAIGDRHDRRLVMIYSDLLSAGCFAAMAFASAPAALVGIKVVAAVMAAPLIPATGAALPSVSPREELPWANSLLATAGTAGALAGPLLGGMLVAGSSGSLVFALNSVSFLVSALLISTLHGRLRPGADEGREHARLRAGFSFLLQDRVLRPVTLGFALIFLGIGVTLPAEIALANSFGVGAFGYGALVALWGVGGLLGTQLAGRVLRKYHEPPVLVVAAAGMAVAFLATGIAPIFALALCALAVGGASEGIGQVAQQLLLQRRTPSAVRSRVLAGSEAVAQAGFAVSLLYAGFLVDWLGAKAVFAFAAGACALGSLALLSASGALNLDRFARLTTTVNTEKAHID